MKLTIKFINIIKNICLLEKVKYLFFGFLTTVLNFSLFIIFSLHLNYKISNLISIVISILFAYIVNKVFVFKSKCNNYIDLIKEILFFFFSRAFTSIVDYFSLIILVEKIFLNKNLSKILVQIVIIILNYVISKYLFCKNKNNNSNK